MNYLLEAVMHFEGVGNPPAHYTAYAHPLPTTDAELEDILDTEARIWMAETGLNEEGLSLDYTCLRYTAVADEPNIGKCGNCFVFFTEENIEGCLPLPTLEAAKAELQKYSDWLCGTDSNEFDAAYAAERAAYNEPEHLAYLDDLCKHVGA